MQTLQPKGVAGQSHAFPASAVKWEDPGCSDLSLFEQGAGRAERERQDWPQTLSSPFLLSWSCGGRGAGRWEPGRAPSLWKLSSPGSGALREGWGLVLYAVISAIKGFLF